MTNQAKNIIFFDGVCNLCNSSVQWIIKNDKNEVFHFASLQSDFGQQLLKERNLDSNNFNSFLFLKEGVLYDKSSAALQVAKLLRFPFFILYAFIAVPKFFRDAVYGYIAENRYIWFGKKDACMIPSPDLKKRFLS